MTQRSIRKRLITKQSFRNKAASTDADGHASQRLIERPEPTPERPQGLCLDAGYDYAVIHELLVEFGFTAHIRSRGEEAQALAAEAGFRARRWVVERTHSWMNRFRRILIRW